ncbi:primase-like protein [Chitinophaga polysaccharea]|uniref:Primase-like protein n=1 Tax=Chitinophaga polysaccharea TaxID=1293035 RepID=A0A561PL40_9BACT|nr:VapE domain-containing protein [Chitinophaga polysaccharea]TWF38835.1 primase-like protein [Chitinophaga polysaccharea]
MSSTVSIYNNIYAPADGKEIPVDILLHYIQDGEWQDDVLAVRTGKKDKVKLPAACMSGKFRERQMSGLIQHSGFICIDIDDVDPEELKSLLCPDKHVYAAFVSAGGKGLALLFKINPDKHAEAFEGLQEYLYTNYQVVVDPSCRDVSRARFVSYDPHMYLNEKADKFCQYPKKPPVALKKVPDIVFVKSDFDAIVKEITTRRIDITGDYATWLRIAFAIADRFGENGRDDFHRVSQFGATYKYEVADRQYTNCLKANKTGITIASFYHFAKQAGIRLFSDQTKLIVQTATFAKKGARSRESVVKMLQEQEHIPASASADIVDQVFTNNVKVDGDSEIDAVELWMRQNYDLRRNAITRYIENNGKPLQAKDFNSIYISSKKVFDKGSYELIDRLINSDFTQDYNPLLEFFEQNKDRHPSGVIAQLFDTINTDTGVRGSEFMPHYASYFGTKWLVGAISAAHGVHSPLMLVLCGAVQGTGKTEWFRRLLPTALRSYYAESKLDAGKDDEILMTQKWFICDDEMGGKSKAEEKRLKELTSKQVFSLREPYGRNNVDLLRLASLCGTTNDGEILSDPTGNRRIIPVNVLSIDHATYNSIDKTDVIMEAYHLWKDGFNWELTRDDIAMLNGYTTSFDKSSIEYDLINRYYELPAAGNQFNVVPRTTTDIKVRLEKLTMQRLSLDRIGKEMARLGYEKKAVKIKGKSYKAYELVEIGDPVVSSGNQ